MTLGENLQRLRRERGLSQEDVAGKLFVSRQSVSKWELDQAEPGVEYLKALAELYGVTLDTLLRGSEAGAKRNSEADSDLILDYRAFFALRTAAAVAANLVLYLPQSRIEVPLDWIAMLVGLGVRKKWVWGVIAAGLGLSLLMNLSLPSDFRLLALIVNGMLLCGVCRKGFRAYFNSPKEE